MLQKLEMARETFSAVLMIASPNTPDKEVHAFEKEIADMEVGDEDLLEAMPFSCCTNAKSVVTSVWRHQE
jgi:hypothetical protein